MPPKTVTAAQRRSSEFLLRGEDDDFWHRCSRRDRCQFGSSRREWVQNLPQTLLPQGSSKRIRKGIEKESITLHPSGLTHGPQPGKIEESIGVKETNEIAVMIDTFKPLKITNRINEIDDENYPLSWLKNDLRSS